MLSAQAQHAQDDPTIITGKNPAPVLAVEKSALIVTHKRNGQSRIREVYSAEHASTRNKEKRQNKGQNKGKGKNSMNNNSLPVAAGGSFPMGSGDRESFDDGSAYGVNTSGMIHGNINGNINGDNRSSWAASWDFIPDPNAISVRNKNGNGGGKGGVKGSGKGGGKYHGNHGCHGGKFAVEKVFNGILYGWEEGRNAWVPVWSGVEKGMSNIVGGKKGGVEKGGVLAGGKKGSVIPDVVVGGGAGDGIAGGKG